MDKGTTRLLILLFSLGPWWGNVAAQKADGRKADKWYREKAYFKAIPLYEQGLREQFRAAPAQKLAQAYRLTNQWEKAVALLDTAVATGKVKEDMWFLYAESLMANGRYEEARNWFLRHAASNPGDSLSLKRAEACLIVGDIPPFFGTVRYQPIPVNVPDADDHAAVPWNGGLVFTSDRSPGVRLLQEKSAWTGRHFLHLFFTRPLTDSTWTEPEPWSGRLNAQNLHAGYAFFSRDSQTVWFTRNASSPNDRGLYPLQLFTARQTGDDRWTRPEPVSFANEGYNMMHPAVSPDGQVFVFASDRGGGEGGLDLWMCRRQGDDWSRPFNPGIPLNTAAHDAFPFFDRQGRLFFASRGHAGFGGYDLFVALPDGKDGWQPPRNLGRPLNSPMDDITFYLDPGGGWGYFSSTRDGGDDDLYYWEAETVSRREVEESPSPE